MIPKSILLVWSGILFLSEIHAQNSKVAGPAEMMKWNISDFTPLDIVIDINMRQFDQADTKIIKMGVFSPGIARIVKLIYNKNMKKFVLLNDYGYLSTQIPISYGILTALWDEMASNGHMDVYNLMTLDDSLSRKVIYNHGASDDMRTKAVSVRDGIRRAIVENAAEILNEGILDGSFPYSHRYQGLANALHTFDEQISDDTIRKVIDDVYGNVTPTKLIRFVYSNERLSQTVAAFVHIFYKLEENKTEKFYTAAIMVLTEYLKQLTDALEGLNTLLGKKNLVSFVVSRLPTFVRNLYFSNTLCIRNLRYSEYLYSPKNSYALNLNTRFVCTLGNNKSDHLAHWTAKKLVYQEASFQLMSEHNAMELLFVADVPHSQLSENDQRSVITFMPGDSLGNNSTSWTLEVFEEFVLIVNLHYSGYLCADYDDKKRRVIYTLDKAWYVQHGSNCRWAVDIC